VTRSQLAVVALLCTIATVAILTAGGAASGSPSAIGAALAGRVVIDARAPAPAPAPAPPPAVDSAPADAAPASAPPVAPAADPTPSRSRRSSSAGAAKSADPRTAKPHTTAKPRPSKIEHVFVIALAGHGFDATFGAASTAPYLTKQLVPRGTLLTHYHALGRADLPDLLAMIGGQPPNADTTAGCPTYREFAAATKPGDGGVVPGAGCVYPNTVISLADQVTASGRTWRAYVEDIDKGPAGSIACRHPDSDAPDDAVTERPGDGYATRHNPFVYFHSLLDLGDCGSSDGPLGRLATDLQTLKGTPNLAYIAPSLCDDGTASPCLDGRPGGLPSADAFLATWVPLILRSPAYRRDGLLVITFAGSVAPASGAGAPRNGTLLLSRFAKPGATVTGDFDPYAILRSVEDLFGFAPLARAADAASFAASALPGAVASASDRGARATSG
jgi:hypothetical protein